MKRQIFTLLLCAVIGTSLLAQPTGVIKKATTAPVVDGVVDEVWATANVYSIDQPLYTETATLGDAGTTTWKALWTENGIFVLLQVNDDIFFPAFSGAVPGNNWEYDKPEVYFDVNADLVDGVGAQGNAGHYQVAPGFVDGELDGTAVTGTDGVINAFLVTDPTYVAEYFVPFTKLLDRDGTEVIKTNEIGFDVTIIDRDDEGVTRMRQVWANIGTINESWTNMDECGIVTLEGAGDAVLATSITVSSAGDATTITSEAGTLQMSAAILPASATVKTAKWTVTDGTGKATISSDGLLTAKVNGTVTVTATTKDGSNKSASKEITISGQIVSLLDVSIIKDGDFPTDGPIGGAWAFWSDNGGTAEVVGGVCTMYPVEAVDQWKLQVNQTNWVAYNDSTYQLTFTSWADADRVYAIDMEDPNNSYARFGATSDAEAVGGRSEWLVSVTTEPTTFTFTVMFDQILENTKFLLNIMPSVTGDVVYIDDISLVSVNDLPRVSNAVKSTSANKVVVFPNPVTNQLNVSLSSANSKVAIYNSLGRKVEEVNVSGNKTSFDVSNYAHGLYFVKVNNDTVVKFVK